MVDITAIGGALSSLKMAYEITKAMKDLDDATKVQGIVFELQRVILEAQGSAIEARETHSMQVDRIRELEKEVADFKAWNAEKQNYDLKSIEGGAFAYMLKPDMRGSEPAHWLCQHCYENGKKMLLQAQGRTPDKQQTIYKCPSCKSTLNVHWSMHPEWK